MSHYKVSGVGSSCEWQESFVCWQCSVGRTARHGSMSEFQGSPRRAYMSYHSKSNSIWSLIEAMCAISRLVWYADDLVIDCLFSHCWHSRACSTYYKAYLRDKRLGHQIVPSRKGMGKLNIFFLLHYIWEKREKEEKMERRWEKSIKTG